MEMLPAIAVSSAVLLAGETVRISDYDAPIPRRSGEGGKLSAHK